MHLKIQTFLHHLKIKLLVTASFYHLKMSMSHKEGLLLTMFYVSVDSGFLSFADTDHKGNDYLY